uniref:Oxidation resistance protein 1 n=1 Tax=Macrostomum lignano TaxID=282301 RepID=A0A1I8I2R3_9PLAT
MDNSQDQDLDFSIDILEQIGLKDSFSKNYIGETSRQLKNLGSHSQSVDQVWSSLKTTVRSVSESISDTVNMETQESISERLAQKKKKRKRRKRMKPPKESTGSTGSASEKATIEYTVRDRDTLNSIAARFNSTPSELCLLNRRSNRIVFPGMRLIVPDPDAPPPPSPTAAGATAEGGGCQSLSKSQSESSNFSSTSTNGEDDAIGSTPAAAAAAVPAAVEPPKPPPEDPHERKFIKAKVRLMTHGDGVVSGTLLVTPNTILFDPNVSDPLVIERGPDMYSVAHPLGHVMSLNAYNTPELMALRREERLAAAVAGGVSEYALAGAEAASSWFSQQLQPAAQQLMVDLSCGLFSTQRHDLRQVTDLSQPPAQLAAERLHPHTCTQFEDRPLYLCVSLKPRAMGGPARSGSRRGKRGPISASRQDELWFSVDKRDADMLYVFLRRCGAAAAAATAGGAAAAGGAGGSGGTDQSQPLPSRSGQPDDYYFMEGGAAGSGNVAGSWQLICADQTSLILPGREDLPLPRLVHGRSRLLTNRRLRHLVKVLPPRAEGLNLSLLYSAGRHGFSLKSAYRACAENAAAPDSFCLLLVLDTDAHLFGAFLSGVMRQSEHYYGTGETFVFRWERPVKQIRDPSSGSGGSGGSGACQFNVEAGGDRSADDSSQDLAGNNNDNKENDEDNSEDEDEDEEEEDSDFYQYCWTGENTYFMRGATDAFTVGSCRGRCAIWLDSGLFRGRSQRCDTFNSPVLCGPKEDFLVRDIELWEFADPTQD